MSIHIDTSVYIIGDVHGCYQPIRDFYYQKMKHNQENDIEEKNITLILLGDFSGNFFFNYHDDKFKTELRSYDMTYFVIRGNHEERPSICMNKNPNAWHMEEFWGNQVYVENDYPYIKYALDTPAKYEIPTAQDKPIKTLVLPGAYSVDKYVRLANDWSWFPQEQCNEEEMAAGIALAQSDSYDLVLSHTCPTIYEPTDLFLSVADQSTVDKTTERWLGGIEYNLDYKLWVFGHFHDLRVYPEYQGKQMLMLFNDCFLDVYKYFCGHCNLYNSLIKTYENTNIDNLDLIFK